MTVRAFNIISEDESAIYNIIDKVYKKVAEKYSTTYMAVERDMRTVIKKAWNRNPELFNEVLDYAGTKVPTVSVFLTLLLEKSKK